jgi:hypothetical protein
LLLVIVSSVGITSFKPDFTNLALAAQPNQNIPIVVTLETNPKLNVNSETNDMHEQDMLNVWDHVSRGISGGNMVSNDQDNVENSVPLSGMLSSSSQQKVWIKHRQLFE